VDVSVFEELALRLGINWGFLLGGIPAVIVATEFAKKQLGLTGRWNLIPAGAVSLAVATASAKGVVGIVLAAAALLVASGGSWQAVKNVAQRIGTNGKSVQ
jgi:hypothetical protein